MTRVLCATVVIAVGLAAMKTSVAQSSSEQLDALFAERLAWTLREFPEIARSKGDYSSADRITDGSLSAIEHRHAETADHLRRLRQIDRAALDESARLNYDLFERKLAEEIEGHRFRVFLAPIGGRFGPQQDIPQMHERVRFAGYEDYENYLKRLEQTPRRCADTRELLRAGLAEGRTPPKVALAGVPEQFRELVDGDGLAALAEPFARFPAGVTPAQQQALRTRFEQVSRPAARAALRELGDYFTREYLPRCRASIAARDWPDGEAWYAFALRMHTTTDLTAEQIHEIGLREVARIRAEMLTVIRRSDFMQHATDGAAAAGPATDGDADSEARLFRDFLRYLRTAPRFYYQSGDELLTGYRDICKRIDAELPRLFRVLPRLPYGVRKIPDFMAPTQTTAYYSPGDIRNGEPGYFYANTYALDQRPRYEMIALSLHEAVPGHHLQIALAQELTDLPEFRRDAWFTAFGEGWALYSERLGIEMGLFDDPYDDFGRLLYEMWRACRLVVDPGMHALGWSRQQSIDFMLANTALSELNINAEVDRYIAWPGQATAYKIGELKIRELRAACEQKLGARFDIRAFHEVVLGAGTVPLTVLETRVRRWCDSVAAR
jgi:uncharacterized protein (DUF885 family)